MRLPFLVLCACLTSCHFNQSAGPLASDPSIVMSGGKRINPKVENGTAYDRGMVEIGSVTKIVLPTDATVRRDGEPGKAKLFLAKQLTFLGHPPAEMTPYTARKYMGCATRTEGNVLTVATFGEWDSRIEGDATLKLVAVVPAGVEVEQRAGLAGMDSPAARRGKNAAVTTFDDKSRDWWYGSTAAADGWTAVPTVPDTDRSAEK